jgi:geranylgeranylglycerol-phosphate geranylgeranyltransferase
MRLSGFFAITRPLNAFVSGLAAILGYIVATGAVTVSSLVLFPIVVLITAAGNVINDYFDAEIDAVNRPDRPIPSGTVRKSAARSFAVTLFLAGILLAFFTNALCFAIALFNSLLLAAYAARFKGVPLAGNIIVSYLAASIFLFGGALAGFEGLVPNLPLAAIAFFATLARELVKDAEDVEGDRAGGAVTLPIQSGVPLTCRLAFACSLLAVIASIFPYFTWGVPYLAGIAAVDAIILLSTARAVRCTSPACVKASKASSLLKAGFFASLLVFAAAAFLL